ncbi:hypothetical protein E6H36_12400 [Candidatus Bathyarchaeota archaeon]|nr:MAG: hypothetical protein E6H36_12400 [Candidatus Bathyarchaeota archaeon]
MGTEDLPTVPQASLAVTCRVSMILHSLLLKVSELALRHMNRAQGFTPRHSIGPVFDPANYFQYYP